MISELELHREELETICRRHNVRRLEIFGSAVSRASFTENSDLDFLVEFDQPTCPGYADRYFGLLEDLEALLGRHVDLVVDSAIKNPYFRTSVEKSKAPVYAR